MKKVSMVVLLLVGIGVFSCHARTSMDYGKEEWITWTLGEKVAYVHGFGIGMYVMYLQVTQDIPELEEYMYSLITRTTDVEAGALIEWMDYCYTLPQYEEATLPQLILNMKQIIEEIDGNN